jgi:hypothetical protein
MYFIHHASTRRYLSDAVSQNLIGTYQLALRVRVRMTSTSMRRFQGPGPEPKHCPTMVAVGFSFCSTVAQAHLFSIKSLLALQWQTHSFH